MASPLVVAVEFLDSFGFFDIVLPFLLVFTIVFAILEKTMILGHEGPADEPRPKKNINSMVAFAIALFVVAASNIVEVIKEALPMITLVLIVLICFMLLASSFAESGKFKIEGNWQKFLTTLLFVGVVMIFMSVIKTDSGESWLRYIWNYILDHWATGPVVSGIIFVAIIIGVIVFVTIDFGRRRESEGGGSP